VNEILTTAQQEELTKLQMNSAFDMMRVMGGQVDAPAP
jgi:hypothetical protein